MKQTLLFLSFISVFMACSPKNPATAMDYFGEATKLKAATQAIQQGFKEDLQTLRNHRNGIMVQGRTLTDAELKLIEGVNEIISDNGEFNRYLEDIDKSENAYEPNGQELLYLNQQANKLAKQIQKKITTIKDKL